jgi:hypothetical protein
LKYQTWINNKTNKSFNQTRILSVLPAAQGAEKHLPVTIPRLIQQMEEIGIGLDLVLGLNNGFTCPPVIDRISQLTNVKVIHLYAGDKASSTTPALIYDNPQLSGESYCLKNESLSPSKHRIFVLNQPQGIYAPGRIRILGDIYFSLFLHSIDRGWVPPSLLMTIDAETQFLATKAGIVPDPNSNGLSLMVEEMHQSSELELISTTLTTTVYQETTLDEMTVLIPDFEAELPALDLFLNLVHGQYYGYLWNNGGGTIGRTATIISIAATIAEKYPGIRVEDVQQTLLAKHLGFQNKISSKVISTNYVPAPTAMLLGEKPQPAWIDQFYRWMTSSYGLETYYGKHNVREIINSIAFPWWIWIYSLKLWRRIISIEKNPFSLKFLYTLTRLILSLWTFSKLRQKALQQPDLITSSQANASW